MLVSGAPGHESLLPTARFNRMKNGLSSSHVALEGTLADVTVSYFVWST